VEHASTKGGSLLCTLPLCHAWKGHKPHTNFFVSVLSKNLPHEILLAITSYTTKAIDAVKTAQNQQAMHEAHYKCRIRLLLEQTGILNCSSES
jgi:hypothetical protein